MDKNDPWIYGEILLKRWDISERLLDSYVRDGLPAYDRDNERIDMHSIDRVEGYRFKIKDIEEFELQNEILFRHNKNLGDQLMDAKERRELGQLRGEKEKWDSSIEIAMQIGMYCQEQNRELNRKEVEVQAFKIDKNLPYSTFEKIWKAIPKKFKSKGGRPARP
jgi:hypothetical protein